MNQRQEKEEQNLRVKKDIKQTNKNPRGLFDVKKRVKQKEKDKLNLTSMGLEGQEK